MFELIEAIILSDFLVLTVFVLMLLAVIVWALQIKEFAGLILGVLISIFLITVWVTITGDTNRTQTEQPEDIQLSFLTVMLPAVFGLLLGFVVLFVVRVFGTGSGVRQGVTVTILIATLLGVLFFLATAGEYTRRLIGIFALAFAIGALTTFVLRVGSSTPTSTRRPTASQQSAPEPASSSQEIQQANIQNAPPSRLDNIRRYFNNEDNQQR